MPFGFGGPEVEVDRDRAGRVGEVEERAEDGLALISLDLDGAEVTRWPAAISIGTNPTFDGTDRTVEAYALDRDDLDLYGTHAAIEFTVRLRGNEKFDSVPALVAQMREDVDQARALTAG